MFGSMNMNMGSRGPVSPYGPELILNGDFASGDLTSWEVEADVSAAVVDGQGVITVVGSNAKGFGQGVATEIGATYRVQFDTGAGDSGNFTFRIGPSLGSGAISSGTVAANTEGHSFEVVATGTTMYVTFRPNSTTDGHTAAFDNISVRKVN